MESKALEKSKMDTSEVTGQLTDNQVSDKPTCRQSNLLTVQLVDNQLADTPTRRQTNSPKLIYGRFGTWTCLFGSWTLRSHTGCFSQSLKPRSDWQVSGTEIMLYCRPILVTGL